MTISIEYPEGQLELDLGAQTNETNKYKKVSDLDMYQQVAKTTAIYPREQAIIYPTLGLTGEAGEVANKVKKIIRDGSDKTSEDMVQALSSEIGDCLWYIAVLADDVGIKLSDIANANLEKLFKSCLLYTSPSPRDLSTSRMPSSA